MTAKRIDGRAIAAEIRTELKAEVAEFTARTDVTPCLGAILVGEDPASEVYVRHKQKACEKAGIDSRLHRLPAASSEDELLSLVGSLSREPAVHGILVQLPLPDHIQASRVLDAVDPLKDVDAFHPHNVGLISQGRPRYLPCTPHGVLQILKHSGIPCAGKHAVIVGRSDIVGKPLAMLLAQRDNSLGPEFANATVTICHSRTADLGSVTRRADILIAAIGQPNFITGEMIKPGAAVMDVGVNRTADGLCGDVDFASAAEVAGQITPVPGGVGPLTVTMLLANTLQAARLQCSNQS